MTCCLHMTLLPVMPCLCSPALAPSCSFSRAEAAPQTSSAALPGMSLKAGYELDRCMLALRGTRAKQVHKSLYPLWHMQQRPEDR